MKLSTALKITTVCALLHACGVEVAGLGELTNTDAGATPFSPSTGRQTTVDYSATPSDAGIALRPLDDAGDARNIDAASAAPLASAANDASQTADSNSDAMSVGSFESASIQDGGLIPELHTCVGRDISPAFSWSPGPVGTGSYAVVLRNLDATGYDLEVLWVLWNIPSSVTSIPQDIGIAAYPTVVPGAVQVTNGSTFGLHYNGPCAVGEHHYEFALYALSSAQVAGSPLSPPLSMESMVLAGGVLEKRSFVATFNKP